MKIGFMGLGKLGLPCALAIERAGHEVMGYDPSYQVIDIFNTRKLPYREEGAQELLQSSKVRLVSVHTMVEECDLIFVAVQTPHDPRYEGITRLPKQRVDFDYRYLQQAMEQLASAAVEEGKHIRVVVISTVLPGTIDSRIQPIIDRFGGFVKLCYNPFFIAMGTTIHDFTHPEFVLFGVDDPETAKLAEDFYRTIHDRPFYKTTIRNAEMIKVAYNTFISTKIAFVNTLMQLCHRTACDIDAVTDALKMANERLISTKYLTGGMGDGGGCHPRDNIALSWLARTRGLDFDFFEAIMMQRECQTDWFADMIENSWTSTGKKLPVVILGKAFKPETNLTVGSPAVLLGNILKERGIDATYLDPIVYESDNEVPLGPAVYFIGCRHEIFAKLRYPEGSVVLDPHRYVPDQRGVTVVRIGEGHK